VDSACEYSVWCWWLEQDVEYVDEPTRPQRRKKNAAPQPRNAPDNAAPPPPCYDASVQPASRKDKKTKKSTGRDDEQHNVCHTADSTVSCVLNRR